MFRKWMQENRYLICKSEFSTPIFPPAADRAFWDDKSGGGSIRAAEAYLGYEIPPIRATQYLELQRSGSRVAQEQPHFARRLALANLIIGELCEYQGRFLPDITDLLFAICEESFWGLSAHLKHIDGNPILPPTDRSSIDLFVAETAALVALGSYLFKEELEAYCPGIVARCQYELERRVKTPYLTTLHEWWMGYFKDHINNWNPWILSNILTVFLLWEPDLTRRQDAIRKMLFEIDYIYQEYPEDGGCDEGPDYWMVSGASLFEFMEQLYIATDGAINFYHDEKIKRIARYERYAYIGEGAFANFADAVSKTSHNCSSILYLFGKRIGDEALASMAKDLQKPGLRNNPMEQRSAKLRRELWQLIYQKEIDALPPFPGSGDALLPVLQNAFLRRGNWYLAAKGGNNNEHHNHNDVGSFIAYYENKPVLCDPGIGTYTKFTFGPDRFKTPGTQSVYHNLPLVNGQPQPFGGEFKADRFAMEGSSIAISFAGAYPESAGLDQLERELHLSADGLKMKDRFVFRGAEKTIAEHFMTPLSVRIEGDTAILGEQFALTLKGASIATDRMDFEGDPKYINAWGCPYLTRIKFECQNAETISMELRKL